MKPEIIEAEAYRVRAFVRAMAWETASNLAQLGIVGLFFWWVLA